MINEQEKNNEKSSNANNQFDARIVHTVRNLKKLPSRHSDENSSGLTINSRTREHSSNNGSAKNLAKSVNERVSVNMKNTGKNIFSNLNERISIDGSGQSTSDSIKADADGENELNSKLRKSSTKAKPLPVSSSKNINTFKYSYSNNINVAPSSSTSNFASKFAPMKTKSEFQKRLMSENNIVKYKASCVGIIKDDDEIKKMCEICFGISPGTLTNTNSMFGNPNQIYDSFIEENLFSDKFFLYKLESLLNSDVTKQNRDKFFKQEIKKAFEIKVIEIQYQNKLNGLNFAIDNHIHKIQTYEFFN